MDGETGQEQWAFETGNMVRSSPTVVDGTVFIGSWDDNLYAVDAETGTQEWAFEVGGPIRSSPTVADGTVFFGSSDDNLYAMDGGVTGSSEGTRVILGTLGYHEEWLYANQTIESDSSSSDAEIESSSDGDSETDDAASSSEEPESDTDVVSDEDSSRDILSEEGALLAVAGLLSAGGGYLLLRNTGSENNRMSTNQSRDSEQNESEISGSYQESGRPNASSTASTQVNKSSDSEPQKTDNDDQTQQLRQRIQNELQSIQKRMETAVELVLSAEYTKAQKAIDEIRSDLTELEQSASQNNLDQIELEIRNSKRECSELLSDDSLLSQLRKMDPYDFEKFVSELWERKGWSTQITRGSNDRGVDVVATKEDSFDKRRHLVQVKRYGENTKVGSEDIQRYAGLYSRNEQVDNVLVASQDHLEPSQHSTQRSSS